MSIYAHIYKNMFCFWSRGVPFRRHHTRKKSWRYVLNCRPPFSEFGVSKKLQIPKVPKTMHNKSFGYLKTIKQPGFWWIKNIKSLFFPSVLRFTGSFIGNKTSQGHSFGARYLPGTYRFGLREIPRWHWRADWRLRCSLPEWRHDLSPLPLAGCFKLFLEPSVPWSVAKDNQHIFLQGRQQRHES